MVQYGVVRQYRITALLYKCVAVKPYYHIAVLLYDCIIVLLAYASIVVLLYSLLPS